MANLPVADRVIELFGRGAHEGLADQLLALATDSDFTSIRVAGCDEDVGVVLECSDSSHVVGSRQAGPLHVLRSLLEHFTQMAETDGGLRSSQFGTKLRIDRPTVVGPVRLSVEFANTSEIQYLAIEKATSNGSQG
ncbi:MAG: hypothetical protein C0467_04625 [Planctomycetaceae bacterium]|nr:hypothetical protein [Planctomycetaceae bacterium]